MMQDFSKQEKKQVDLDKKYPALAEILCDWCLLRHIILKQKKHCENNPTDIKQIRTMYYSFTDPYHYGFTVEKFIQYINYCLMKLIWYDKYPSVLNIYDMIYKFGNDCPDNYWFTNLEDRISEINLKLSESFFKHFDFENDKISFSYMKIEEYCRDIIEKGKIKYGYNRNEMINTVFFKSYITGNYSLSIDLDSIDVKLNGKYYNKYVYSSVKTYFDKTLYVEKGFSY